MYFDHVYASEALKPALYRFSARTCIAWYLALA
jgi:hypothetical protein